MRSRTRLSDGEGVWDTAKGDLRRARGLQAVGVVGLLVWMAFQWGFGNDALLPSIAANAFDLVDDGESWRSGVSGVLAATVASFVFWGGSQLLDAIVMLSGLRLVPGLTDRLSAYLRRRGLVKPFAELRWTTRWALAYATGVSVICLVDVFATGRPGLRHRWRMILVSVWLSAGTVAGVVAMVVTAAMVATRIPSIETEATIFIRVAKNPLTWITLFGVIFLVGYLRRRAIGRVTPNEDSGADVRRSDDR